MFVIVLALWASLPPALCKAACAGVSALSSSTAPMAHTPPETAAPMAHAAHGAPAEPAPHGGCGQAPVPAGQEPCESCRHEAPNALLPALDVDLTGSAAAAMAALPLLVLPAAAPVRAPAPVPPDPLVSAYPQTHRPLLS